MPALRGKEQEAARADLIALRLYLRTAKGPLSHGAVTRALREYEDEMLPYAACVASALNRLPSYRGAMLRGTGAGSVPGGADAPLPGAMLRDPALVSAVPFDSANALTTPDACYVIWSATGRRVRQLLGTGHGAEEVVFAPGTLFQVLDVRSDDTSVQIFLRELTGPHNATERDLEADRAALARLDEAVRGRSAAAGTGQWPERCAGPIGTGP